MGFLRDSYRIDYSRGFAVIYDGGVSAVRIDDNSMLCIFG